ncbi:GNAT family N-acetyltransferase [Aneurinibacillus sp. UBA3580]|uniref:GNAT family N-acetyltransferase n=1 Tax=Aneurinibacillus sp. UBA3580 TaxID=1946041 RepID=UPI00257F4309|nr:GNAT family N-acetyltransferase [Aneurinibacillus sp. UBA3580]
MYKHLSQDRYQEKNGYSVCSIREQDMLLIKEWRNAQMDVLRQNRLLTDKDQMRYYRSVVQPSFTQDEPKIMLFSFFNSEEFIGYGGLTNIDWISGRAEISFLLNPVRTIYEDAYEADFLAFLSLMRVVAFKELGFNRLFTETFDIRPYHISILEKFGFRLEGRMKQHVYIHGQFVDSLLHGYLKEYWNDEE